MVPQHFEWFREPAEAGTLILTARALFATAILFTLPVASPGVASRPVIPRFTSSRSWMQAILLRCLELGASALIDLGGGYTSLHQQSGPSIRTAASRVAPFPAA